MLPLERGVITVILLSVHESTCAINRRRGQAERAANENVDSCRRTSTHTVLEEMQAGSCVPPDVGQHTYQHMSGLKRCAPQFGRSRCSTGRQHKGSRHHANSTCRKDLGAVVPATAARAHNCNTFAFPARLKQIGPPEFGQQPAGSPLGAPTADVRTVTALEATGGLSQF